MLLVWPVLLAVVAAPVAPVAPDAPVSPVALRGTTKNGTPIIVVETTGPVAVAALHLIIPEGADVTRAIDVMTTAALAVAGPEATLTTDRGHVDALNLVVSVPASTPDLAVRAINAALKAARAPAPPLPPPPPPGGLGHKTDVDPRFIAHRLQVALARLGPGHVSVAVVAPGPLPALLRRTSALIAAPLDKSAVPPARRLDRCVGEVGSSTLGRHAILPGGNVLATRAALEVLLKLVERPLIVPMGRDVCVVDPGPDSGSVAFTTIMNTPPPQPLIDDAVRDIRLFRTHQLRDPAAVARIVAEDLAAEVADGPDTVSTLALFDALGAVEPAAVADAARRVLEVMP